MRWGVRLVVLLLASLGSPLPLYEVRLLGSVASTHESVRGVVERERVESEFGRFSVVGIVHFPCLASVGKKEGVSGGTSADLPRPRQLNRASLAPAS